MEVIGALFPLFFFGIFFLALWGKTQERAKERGVDLKREWRRANETGDYDTFFNLFASAPEQRASARERRPLPFSAPPTTHRRQLGKAPDLSGPTRTFIFVTLILGLLLYVALGMPTLAEILAFLESVD